MTPTPTKAEIKRDNIPAEMCMMNANVVSQEAISMLDQDFTAPKIMIDGKSVNNTPHNRTILKILHDLDEGDYGCRGFRKALRKHIGDEIFEECAYAIKTFVPDVWQIKTNEDGHKEIVCYEVESHHRISIKTLRSYVSLWFAFDCEDPTITLRLIGVFNYVDYEICIASHYASFLKQDLDEYEMGRPE